MQPPGFPPPPRGYEARMPRFEEERALVIVGRDVFGRGASLIAEAADAWISMRRAAEVDGVHLLLVSAFRSVARQREIVAKKLQAGLALDEILRASAYPGHSEHHTGRAIDIGSPQCEHLSECFEQTPEFAWLVAHAAFFHFSLTYPRDNPQGIAFEPWHWCWGRPKSRAETPQS